MSDAASAQNESFYTAAATRIPRFMIFVGALFSIAGWLRFGWHIALGFASGCAIAYLNFRWLERVVAALADRATSAANRHSTGGVVARFLVRYLLMALSAYAIFSVSPASLYGLFAGLFLPVAGIACEAVYEIYAAYARGL
jgi:ATP synthase I chain